MRQIVRVPEVPEVPKGPRLRRDYQRALDRLRLAYREMQSVVRKPVPSGVDTILSDPTMWHRIVAMHTTMKELLEDVETECKKAIHHEP